MKFEKAYIPFGAYWSTPYCKWQGSFSHIHSMKLGAEAARAAMAKRKIDPKELDLLVLGMTVPQRSSFYGAPWLAGMIGADRVTGPTISQACATSARCITLAVQEVEQGSAARCLVMLCDRTSNSPHIYYPNPKGMGGVGDKEDWVLDNFGHDPFARNAMIQTAENVAKKAGIGRKEQEEVALLRSRQYQDALKDDKRFQRTYMILPYELKDPSGKKIVGTVDGDEGVFPTTAEGLAKLKSVLPEGTVTFGTQTFPADGSTALMVCSKGAARGLSRVGHVTARVVSGAQARVEVGFMPMATVPASQKAMADAGIGVGDIKAIKTHNPFALNDIVLSRELGIPWQTMNNYGCSLVYGHPQAPTGARLVVELIEELAEKGGGYGLFTGCAAGDSAFSLIVKVET